MKRDVINCPRCGGDHVEIESKSLTRPMDPGEIFWAWESYSICPATGEPILDSLSWAFLTGPDGLSCAHPYYEARRAEMVKWQVNGEPIGGLETP